MQSLEEPLFSEEEAAARLGVTLERLHSVLDEHVFDRRDPRPDTCTFRTSDLVLLAFWLKTEINSKVLRMPKRN